MESERKSVFARLGVRPSGGDSSSGSNSSAGSGGSSRSREDLRHRVAHLSGKRSRGGHHHVPIPIPPPPPPPPPTQSRENNNNNQNLSPKHQSITNQQPESMIICPVEATKSRKKRLVRRKRMKPPVVVEEKDLDEGEIVDDDEEEEEYEEYEEEMEEEEEEAEEGELITKKGPIPNLLPEGDNISMSSLSGQSIQNNDNEGGDSQKESTQQQQNDDDDLESKKEVTNLTIIKSKDLQEPEEPASDYSDWSDGEDDELLQANNSQELIEVEGAPGDDNDQEELEEEEEEMEVVDDSNVAMLINKDNEDDTSDLVDNNNRSSSNIEDNRDLEAISDDDLDPLSDDFLFMNDDHKLNPLESPSSEVPITTGNAEVDDLLNKSEGFGLDGNTNTSTATTASTSTSNADTSGDIKVLDILEIDWKSLITETNRKSIPITDDNNQSMESDSAAPVDSGIPVATVTSPSSASHKNAASHAEYRQRNSTIALLNRIGFSHQLAGPELTAFVQRQLSDKLKDQYQPMLHPVPSVHCYLREKREREDSFFTGQHQDSATGGMINPGGAGLPLNGAKIEAFGNLVL